MINIKNFSTGMKILAIETSCDDPRSKILNRIPVVKHSLLRDTVHLKFTTGREVII